MRLTGDLDMVVEIGNGNATGANILWGHREDKLYHSYLTYQKSQRIGALVKDQPVYVRVDGFNENGITRGKVVRVR